MGKTYLEHVPNSSAEGMVDKPEIEVAAALYERGYGSIVSAEGQYPFRYVSKGRVCREYEGD